MTTTTPAVEPANPGRRTRRKSRSPRRSVMSWMRMARSGMLRARVDIGARAFYLLAGFGLTFLDDQRGADDPAAVGVLLILVATAMCCWAVIDGPGTPTYRYALMVEAAFAVALVTLTTGSVNSE